MSHGDLNQRQLDCLLNSLLMVVKRSIKPRTTGKNSINNQDFPTNGQLCTFICHDVIFCTYYTVSRLNSVETMMCSSGTRCPTCFRGVSLRKVSALIRLQFDLSSVWCRFGKTMASHMSGRCLWCWDQVMHLALVQLFKHFQHLRLLEKTQTLEMFEERVNHLMSNKMGFVFVPLLKICFIAAMHNPSVWI